MTGDPIVVPGGPAGDAPLAVDAAAGALGAAAAAAEAGAPVAPEIAAAVDGALASKMRARFQSLKNRTKQFSVPPWDVWGDDLVLVGKPIDIEADMTNEQVVVQATVKLLARDDDTGKLEEIPGGWAGAAKLMGISDDQVTLGQIVKQVTSSKEALGGLAEQIVAFTMGRRSQLEQALGE